MLNRKRPQENCLVPLRDELFLVPNLRQMHHTSYRTSTGHNTQALRLVRGINYGPRTAPGTACSWICLLSNDVVPSKLNASEAKGQWRQLLEGNFSLGQKGIIKSLHAKSQHWVNNEVIKCKW